MKLKETAALMLSDDYKERLKAEYWQVRNRYNSLMKSLYVPNNKRAKLSDEQKELMKKQSLYMYQYMLTLSKRCKLEGVDVNA